jgi:hypothetical protein
MNGIDEVSNHAGRQPQSAIYTLLREESTI